LEFAHSDVLKLVKYFVGSSGRWRKLLHVCQCSNFGSYRCWHTHDRIRSCLHRQSCKWRCSIGWHQPLGREFWGSELNNCCIATVRKGVWKWSIVLFERMLIHRLKILCHLQRVLSCE